MQFPDARGLRPTADRVRETLFNWLQNDIAGSTCLDLFAGSGALGFEAVSRGAGSVTMIESAAPVARVLAGNAGLLKVSDRLEVHQAKAAKWLGGDIDKTYDIVFVDPPFADNLLEGTLHLLQKPGVLAENALIYVERDAGQVLPELPGEWELVRDKKAGQVAYSLIKCGN